MGRFSIMVTEYGSDHEVLLCDVDANPQRIVDGLKGKRLKLRFGPKARRPSGIGRYDRTTARPQIPRRRGRHKHVGL
jgi:hypothetical protein